MSPALHSAHIALLSNQNRLPTAAQVLIFAAVVVTKWDRLRRNRKSLAKLETHQLNDIGLGRSTAETEAQKPFWRD